jgi:hypothetical protein
MALDMPIPKKQCFKEICFRIKKIKFVKEKVCNKNKHFQSAVREKFEKNHRI